MHPVWNDVPKSSQPQPALIGGGIMGDAIRAFDWSTTPLGPLDEWPAAIRITVSNLLASGQPTAFFAGSDLTTIYNDGFRPILGKRANMALGQPIQAVWFDVWDDIRPLVLEALSGATVWREDMPLTMTRNGFEERTFWTFSYSPVRDEQGDIMGFLDVVTESTNAVAGKADLEAANAALAHEVAQVRRVMEELAQSERRLQVLQRELSHRMKNTLAMVQAIVTQSLRHSTSVEEAGKTVSQRIIALGRAQDMLTETNWKASNIQEVVDAAIAPHRDRPDAFRVTGESLDLTPQQAMGLSLAIHELATNAIKYGALSVEGGSVEISWQAESDRGFAFEWREEGGPTVMPPERRGFGSRLTERIVAGYFSGTARIHFEPSGIVFVLRGTLVAS